MIRSIKYTTKTIILNNKNINNKLIRNLCTINNNNNEVVDNLFKKRTNRSDDNRNKNGGETTFQILKKNNKLYLNKAVKTLEVNLDKEEELLEKQLIEKQQMETINNLKEIKEKHMNDLNEFYQKHKDEIESNLMLNQYKKPMALCFAYDGTGYYGLAYNKDLNFIGIENVIEKALFRCGHIAKSNVGDLGRIKWSRSSRTDKGVHSLSTVLSCFLLLDEKTSNDNGEKVSQSFIDNINKYLPQGITCFSATRVPRQFQARKKGSQRTYHYMVPLEHLKDISIDRMNNILSKFIGINSFHNYTGKRSTYIDISNSDHFKSIYKKHQQQQQAIDDESEENNNEEEEEEEEELPKNFKPNRISEKLSFRNNSTNIRNIKEFYVDNEIIEIDGKQWYRFVVVGESFILYQIRKMMGFFMAVAKGYQSEQALDLSLKSPFSVQCPTAPPFSLYLFDVEFQASQSQLLQKNNKSNRIQQLFNPPIRPLQDQFLKNHLIPRFNQIEFQSNQFSDFFNFLSRHHYGLDDLDYVIQLNKEYQDEKLQRAKLKFEKFNNK